MSESIHYRRVWKEAIKDLRRMVDNKKFKLLTVFLKLKMCKCVLNSTYHRPRSSCHAHWPWRTSHCQLWIRQKQPINSLSPTAKALLHPHLSIYLSSRAWSALFQIFILNRLCMQKKNTCTKAWIYLGTITVLQLLKKTLIRTLSFSLCRTWNLTECKLYFVLVHGLPLGSWLTTALYCQKWCLEFICSVTTEWNKLLI